MKLLGHRFTTAQKKAMRRLGVIDEQVIELEETVLNKVAMSAMSVSYGDTRKTLRTIEKASASLANAIDSAPQGSFAFSLLIEAHCEKLADDAFASLERPNNQDPYTLVNELRRLNEITLAALKKIDNKQERNRIAQPFPIRDIWVALIRGWNKKYPHIYSEDSDEESAPAGRTTEWPFRISVDESSPFREIVSYCYEAAGHPSNNQERAIKAYIRLKKKRDEWLDALFE